MRSARAFAWLAAVASASVASAGPAAAQTETPTQIVLDDSFGNPGPLTPVGTTWQIFDDLGRRSGSNLYHSFSIFDVGEGQTASFRPRSASTPQPSFVIARVTAGQLSTINGTVESRYSGADLFLLNPSGFSFGPSSLVQALGSVYVSSADVLRFGGDEPFDAHGSPPDPVLSAAEPTDFGFLSDAPPGAIGDIVFFEEERTESFGLANLRPGETFAAVGRDIRLSGPRAPSGTALVPTIRIEGGSVELAAVRSAGIDVPVDVATFGASGRAPSELGDIELSRNALVDVGSQVGAALGSGRVVIRGEKLVMEAAVLDVTAESSLPGRAVAIDVEVSGGVAIQNSSQLTVSSQNAPVGDLRLAGDSISVTGSSVQSASTGSGVGGAIEIDARELSVTDRGQIVSRPSPPSPEEPDPASGLGGAIDVRVDEDLVVASRGKILSEATGAATSPGGDVTVAAGRSILVVGEDAEVRDASQISALTSSSEPGGTGGRLSVSAPTIEVRDGGQIRTTTSGAAPGGPLDVHDTGLLRIVGTATIADERGVPAGLFARSDPPDGFVGAGDAGPLTIAARVVEVEDGGAVSTRTLGDGAAGSLLIHGAERVSVRGGPRGPSELSTKGAEGAGGGLVIDIESVGGDLELASRGIVSASTLGTGSAGNVVVKADRISISDPDSGLFTQSVQSPGDAGDVVVEVGSWLEVRNGGQISVDSVAARGAAGDVVITGDPGATVAIVGGEISAESIGTAEAGNVTIDAGRDFVAGGGAVVRTSARGNASGGQVAISASGNVYASDARIETQVDVGLGSGGSEGDGGDVGVPPGGALPEFSVLNRTSIAATALDGKGGNIRVAASDLLASQGVVIDPTSERGVSGTVQITGPDADLAGQIVPLPSNFFDAAKLMTAACDARRARAGSFVVQTRTAIPPLPDAPLAPPQLAPVAGAPGDAKCPG